MSTVLVWFDLTGWRTSLSGDDERALRVKGSVDIKLVELVVSKGSTECKTFTVSEYSRLAAGRNWELLALLEVSGSESTEGCVEEKHVSAGFEED